MFNVFSLYVSSALAYSSWFYLLSVLITTFAVLASLSVKHRINLKNAERPNKAEKLDNDIRKYGVQAQYKHLRQKFMEEKLTPQQLDTEKSVESQTLKTIMELLQKRRDIFPAPTMDELKEQLKLYRNSPDN